MAIIQVQNLSKEFRVPVKKEGLQGSITSLFHREHKKVEAVKDISFSIDQGELIGFIGPNGAGKTTSLKMLSGLLYPSSGTISVLGFRPYEKKREFLKKISLVMGQKNQLWWDLPVIESFHLQKDMYEIPEPQYQKRLHSLVELLEVKEVLQTPVRNLSLGQRMKCELISALIYQPEVIFLDEPTIGLDLIVQQKVREFVKEYNREHNATIILTSHYMEDVKELCKRIILIDKGLIIFDGSLHDLIQQYANYKEIILIGEKEYPKHAFEKYGTDITVEEKRVMIHIPRAEVSPIASSLLKDFEIVDLEITEPQLEDVIKKVFQKL
ncbi:ATP-binding cassette domain-containing protein [Candidatus Roizmanbacteria bacterium]|nr:ATP-binding cassette domain-containing protein [Candidatus Roizmanbacteria bacterium]